MNKWLRQYTPADPTISASLNHSWPVIHLVVFIISGRGISYSLQIRKVQRRGWKKRTNEQTRSWVSSKHKRGEVCNTFCAFCELKRACTWVKTLTKLLAMLTHLLTDLFCRLVSSAPFCWLCPSLDWSVRPTGLFCSLLLTVLWDLLSVSHFRSHERSRVQALYVGFTPKQTNRFTD